MMKTAGRAAAVQWGPWQCGIGEANKLVSLGDLVRFVWAREGSLCCEAAELVLDDLQRQASAVEIFERQRGDAYASRVDGDRVLRAHDPGEVDHTEWKRRPGYVVTSWGAFDGAGERHPQHVKGRPARSEAKGPHGALTLAREAWTRKGRALPAALDAPELSRLAVRTCVAAELFGHGLAPAAPIDRPAGMRQHAAKFGHCRTWEGRPRELWRAADVVLALVPPDMAPKAGMRRAVELLASVGRLDWFMLDKHGDRPRLVNDADVWRQRCPSGAEWLTAHKRTGPKPMGWLEMMGEMDADEAHARGCAVVVNGQPRGPELTDAEWSALPELPELRGQSGVIEWLHAAWADRGASGLASLDDDSDGAAAAFLAVPAPAVAGLFAAPLQQVSAVSVEPRSPVAGFGASAAVSKPGPAEWSTGELQTLVDAHAEECRSRGDRGAPGRVLNRWPSLFPARAAFSVTRFNALLSKATAAGITPTGSASWAGSVLPRRGASTSKAKRGTVHKMAG